MQPEKEWMAPDVSRSPGASKFTELASWTRDNDKAILKHIINAEAFPFLEDQTMWQIMEKEMVVVGRSAIEMKERFTTHILWNLDTYTNKFIENKFAHAKRVFLGKHKQERQKDDTKAKQNGYPKQPSKEFPNLQETEKKRKDYDTEEGIVILHALVHKSDIHTGNDLWRTVAKLAEVMQTGLSWKLLKKRFRRYILPNLEYYNLSEEEINKLYRNLKIRQWGSESDSEEAEHDDCIAEDDTESVKSHNAAGSDQSQNINFYEEGKGQRSANNLICGPPLVVTTSETRSIHVENTKCSKKKIKNSIELDDVGYKKSFQKPDRNVENAKQAKSYIYLQTGKTSPEKQARDTSSKNHSGSYKQEYSELEDNTNTIKKIDENSLPTIIKVCKGFQDSPTTKKQSLVPSSRRKKYESNWQSEQILQAENPHKNHDVFTEVITTAVTSTNRSEKASRPTHCLARVEEDSSSIYEAAKPENTITNPREEMAVKFVRNISRQVDSSNAEAKELAEATLMDLAQKYKHMEFILNAK